MMRGLALPTVISSHASPRPRRTARLLPLQGEGGGWGWSINHHRVRETGALETLPRTTLESRLRGNEGFCCRSQIFRHC